MPTILVVDDNHTLAGISAERLRSHGYQTVIAHSLAEAREVLAGDEPIDLATLDLRLPDGDGAELLREIKASSPIPVVIVSLQAEQRADELVASGADYWFQKTIDTDPLMAKIQELCPLS